MPFREITQGKPGTKWPLELPKGISGRVSKALNALPAHVAVTTNLPRQGWVPGCFWDQRGGVLRLTRRRLRRRGMTVIITRVFSAHHRPLPPLPRLVLAAYPKSGTQLEFIMLSAREHEVMLLLAKGLSNKEIAERLEISNGTVKVHLHHIYRSLGIRGRTMLAVLAVQIRHPRDGYPGGSCGSFASSATTKQF